MSSPRTINWNAVRARLAENERRLQEVLQPTPDAVAAVLERRAAALRTRRSEAAVKTAPVLLVTAEGDRLALPATAVTEIIKLESLTSVPGAPVLGIVTVRGEIIAVLSAGRKTATAGEAKWAVSLRHPRLRVAVACSGVEQMVDVPEAELAAATPGEVIRIEGEMALLLDTAAILDRLEAMQPPQLTL